MHTKVINFINKVETTPKNVDTARISAILNKLALESTTPKSAPVKLSQAADTKPAKLTVINIIALVLKTTLTTALNITAGAATIGTFIAANIICIPGSLSMASIAAVYFGATGIYQVPLLFPALKFLASKITIWGTLFLVPVLDVTKYTLMGDESDNIFERYGNLNALLFEAASSIFESIFYWGNILKTLFLIKNKTYHQELLVQAVIIDRPLLNKLLSKIRRELPRGHKEMELKAVAKLKACDSLSPTKILKRINTIAGLEYFLKKIHAKSSLRVPAKEKLKALKRKHKHV